MRTHVALLKGINVGGRNLVKMADLKLMFEYLGFESPQTLLQSGNVAFGAGDAEGSQLETRIMQEFQNRWGFTVDFFVRDAQNWHKVIRENPYPDQAQNDPSHLLVYFMAADLDPLAVSSVRAAIKGPEILTAIGQHLYVVFPDGIGSSTIGRTPGWSKLTSNGTARNWNTLVKLGALLAS